MKKALPYRPAAAIMLLNSENKVFVAQRIDNALDAWQMPQGGLDPGEEPEAGALRELEEETGFRPGRILTLTHGPVSAGLTSEVVTFFRALDLVQVSDGGGDEHEDIVVHRVPRPEVHAFLVARQAAGIHVDPKVYAGLWFLANA